MEVDCDWFLDRTFRNQSCHSGGILNLLLVIFSLSLYFFPFTTFSIFLFLLQDNKAQLYQGTGHSYEIWHFRCDSVPLIWLQWLLSTLAIFQVSMVSWWQIEWKAPFFPVKIKVSVNCCLILGVDCKQSFLFSSMRNYEHESRWTD